MSAEIPVRYHPVAGVLMICCALFILGTSLLTGAVFPLAIVGIVNLIAGIGFVNGAAYVVTDTEVQLRNVLGMTLKRHIYRSLADLQVVDGRVVLDGKKITSGTFLLRGEDIAAVARAVAAARTPGTGAHA